MTVFISRDYSAATSGYASNKFHTPFLYELSIFLYKVLGYTIAGSRGWNLDTIATSISITAATNATPIQVTTTSPHGLTNGQSVSISGGTGNTNVNGTWVVDVTGSSTFTLAGSSGNGTYNAGTATLSTGLLYAFGLTGDGYGTGINFGAGVEKEVFVPIEKRKVVAGDVGKMFVMKSNFFPTKNSGCFKISAINQGTTTTIAVGSNGQSLPQTTINVASTTGFASSGTIFVTTSTGSFAVTYTSTNATQFLGCSGGTGTMSTGGAVATLNRYVLDYRSTENPPAEAVNTINWWLYEIETTASNFLSTFDDGAFTVTSATNASPIVITSNFSYPLGQRITISGATGNTNANGTWTITPLTASTYALNGSSGNGTYGGGATMKIAGYPTKGLTQTSRITFQSPHPAGWQIRLAVEVTSANLPRISVSTGYGADGYGDFAAFGTHTHVAAYFDVDPSLVTTYNNLTTGAGHITTASRMTFVGENSGQWLVAYTRTLGATNNGMIVFGIPDNEPVPLPSLNVERVFCYASSPNTDFGTIILRTGTGTNVGFTNKNGVPDFCALTSWANLDGTSATNPMLSANAGDTPFTSATEVLPIEIWGGITAEIGLTNAGNPPFTYNQRFMGTAPSLRNGRTNFGNFTLTTEEVTTRSVSAATNASPIQITTTATNALVTGQTVTISGVQGNTAANGTWVITVLNNTQFTLNGSSGSGTYTTGGTVNGCPRFLHLQNGIYLQWNGASGLTP